MRETVKSWMMAGLVLLGTRGCGSEEVVVWLHVKNVTAEMTTLQVGLTLDGKPGKQQYEFTQGLGEVAIKLRKEQLGQGKLSVSLTGLSNGRCKVSTGKYEATVRADQDLAEADVALAVMSPAMCLLTVEKVGDGSVTSSPAGVNCGASCTMEVAVGTKVTLTGTRTNPLSAIYYWDGCSAQVDTCEVTFPRKSGQVGYMLEVASEFLFS